MKKIYKLLLLCSILLLSFNISIYAQTLTEIAQIGGGASLANDIKGNTLYFSNGQTLTSANITDPAKPNKIGELKMDLIIINIQVQGNYAYVTTADPEGFFNIVDITDPGNMTLVSTYELGELETDIFEDEVYFSAYLDGEYAYLNKYYELQVINISDPNKVTEESSYKVGGIYFTGGLNKVDNKLLAGIQKQYGAFLATFDVSDPANISMVSYSDTLRYICEGIDIVDTVAYITEADMGIATYNIKDIEKPIMMDTAYYGNWLTNICINNNVAFASILSGGVISISINDPENLPDTILDIHNSPVAYSVTRALSYYNNYLILSSELSGLEVIDATNPADLKPKQIESMMVGGRSTDMTYREGILYIANGTAGLTIVDVTNPSIPNPIGFFDTPGYAYDVCLEGDYCYVGHSSGLSIYNVAEPENAYFVGEFYEYNANGRYVYGVEVRDNIAYCAYDRGGVLIIDISDKTKPKALSNFYSIHYSQPSDVLLIENYLYVADKNTNSDLPRRGSISVVDISNPNNLTTVDTATYGYDEGYHKTYNLVQKDTLLYVADEEGVFVFDISDLAHPKFVKQVVTGEADDIAIAGNYLYVAKGGRMNGYDISNPLVANKIGTFKSKDYTYGVEATNNLCFVADCDAGVFIIQNNMTSWVNLTDDGAIVEGAEDNEVITVTLNGDTFAETLDEANWQLKYLPEGVSLASVSRINDTVVELTLSGNSVESYMNDITNVTVVIKGDEFVNSSKELMGTGIVLNKNTWIAYSEIENLKVYPNPVNDFLNIEADSQIKTIEIFNFYGQKVKQFDSIYFNTSHQLDITNICNGIYLIKITDISGRNSVVKIVK